MAARDLAVTRYACPEERQRRRALRVARLVALNLSVVAQVAPGQTSTLIGRITSDTLRKLPVANAEVSLPGLHVTVRSDSLGYYQIDHLAKGKYAVSVRALGHRSLSDT